MNSTFQFNFAAYFSACAAEVKMLFYGALVEQIHNAQLLVG
jgi:hypothetical protein